MPNPIYTLAAAEDLFKTYETLQKSIKFLLDLKLKMLNSPHFEHCWNIGARNDRHAFTLWMLINGLLIVYRNALHETDRISREALGQLYLTTPAKQFNAWLEQQPEYWR